MTPADLQDAIEEAGLAGLVSWTAADNLLRDMECRVNGSDPQHGVRISDDDPELNRLRRNVVLAFYEAQTGDATPQPTPTPAPATKPRKAPWSAKPAWAMASPPW